jgi:hypothetical protein
VEKLSEWLSSPVFEESCPLRELAGELTVLMDLIIQLFVTRPRV